MSNFRAPLRDLATWVMVSPLGLGWFSWVQQVGSEAEQVVEAALPIKQAPWASIDQELFANATRVIPAGLSATRRAERQAERTAAEAQLRAALDGEQGLEWQRFLEERLRYFQDQPGDWIALAELVVELRRYELAPALATGLEAPAPIHAVAKDGLARLFGKDIETVAEFNAFVDGLELNAATIRLIEQLRAERDRARANEIALFLYDVERAQAALDSTDRSLRLGAAKTLAAVLRDGGVQIDSLAPSLIARVSAEEAPEIAEVIIDSLADAIEGRPAGGPVVEGLRHELAKRAGLDHGPQHLLIARALAQLPWPSRDVNAEDSLERGATLIASFIDGDRSEQDPDVTLGVLQALNSLCVSVSVNPDAAQRLESTELRRPLLALAFDDQEDLSARVVAVGILPRVAPVSSLQDLIRLASRSSGPELPTSLRFAVLGAMGRFAARSGVTDQELQPLVACLMSHAARPEADLRNLALELLGDGVLAMHLEGNSMERFIDRLGIEPDAEVLSKLIKLIGKYGTANDVPRLLALDGFDALAARYLAPDATLSGLIQKLANGDGPLTLSAATRLWSVDAERGLWARREAALAMIAGLTVDEAVSLSADQHRTISVWARELRGAGVSLATSMPGGPAFLERLVEVHLAKSGVNDDFGQGEQNLLAALFLADLAAARGNGEAQRLRDEVLSKFARAEELASEHKDVRFLFAVRSARARFLVASVGTIALVPGSPNLAGGLGVALDDFEFVFESEFAVMLDANDLRNAGLMAAALGRGVDVERAAQFSLALIAKETWNQEPLAVRLLDLQDLAARAIQTGQLELIRNALSAFLELPAELAEGTTVMWKGLTLDGPSWTALQALMVNLNTAEQAALDKLAASDSTLGATGAEGGPAESAQAQDAVVEVEPPESETTETDATDAVTEDKSKAPADTEEVAQDATQDAVKDAKGDKDQPVDVPVETPTPKPEPKPGDTPVPIDSDDAPEDKPEPVGGDTL